jgi:hypothetical protein
MDAAGGSKYWDEVIAGLEARLDLARKAKAVFSSGQFPELQQYLGQTPIANGHAPGKKARKRGEEIMDALQRYFDSVGDKWASIAEMSEGAGVKISAIRLQIYKGNPDRFEGRNRFGSWPLCKEYRLKPAAAE